MLNIFNKNLRRLCTKLRWPARRRAKPKITIKRFGKSNSRGQDSLTSNGSATIHPNNQMGISKPENPIRIATFNAALFSMAPAVPELTEKASSFDNGDDDGEDYRNVKRSNSSVYYPNSRSKSMIDRPKSILKQSPLHSSSMSSSETLTKQQKFAKSKLRVSINLPDNEISLKRSGQLNFIIDGSDPEPESDPSGKYSGSKNISKIVKGKGVLRSENSFASREFESQSQSLRGSFRSTKTVLEVLKELDADILGLQDVKAEEEKDMKPLSDLAAALGMNYVFAESWAPEYGNAILSKWPIKRSRVRKISDDSDFRNVLKATIDVPEIGEIDFDCTLLDHLDENWRMKQINAIIQSNERPHILAGGINSLDETDYSPERWTDIVKYYEEMGKPTPKVEVMKHLKNKQYIDAKDSAGECESVVIIAKGQNVQGTCKYGTRVDYILVSPDSPYKFVPDSYMVLSSKGTSDHHIVKVDITKSEVDSSGQQQQQYVRRNRNSKQKVVKITNSNSSKGVWKMQTLDR